jgi:hypothetical protein
MGRPIKLHNSALRNLAMLRDEFAAWGLKTEAYFGRIRLQREPLLKEDGSLDKDALKLLAEQLSDEKDELVISDWAEDPSSAEIDREFFWGAGGDKEECHWILNELSESAIRCIAPITSLAARLKIDPADLSENLVWDAYWLDVLVKLGLLGSHPIVRTRAGCLSYSRKYNDLSFFDLAGHTLAFKVSDPAMLKRLKKLARTKNRYEELECGIFRGSAYAIDWLLQEVEDKRLA